MKYKLAVSFVMPAYNCTETVAESVQSIVKTNFQENDELIIVNDCSTDNTQRKLEKLKQKYPFIQLIINNENLGCPATRNVGIRRAKNPYIFNLDADDILEKYSRSALENAIINEGADIAAFGENHFFIHTPRILTHKWISKPGMMSLADYLVGHYLPGGNYLYSKKNWEKVGGYDEIGKGLHEFWGFGLKQIAMGSKFYVVGNTHYFHRYGRNSLFSREYNAELSNQIATTLIKPFFGLLLEEDVAYILSEEGKNKWFDQLEKRPIRVKNQGLGIPGKNIQIKNSIYIKIIDKVLYSDYKDNVSYLVNFLNNKNKNARIQ